MFLPISTNYYILKFGLINCCLLYLSTFLFTDFGVSSTVVEYTERGQKLRNTFVGTPCWMAPEIMEQVRLIAFSRPTFIFLFRNNNQ